MPWPRLDGNSNGPTVAAAAAANPPRLAVPTAPRRSSTAEEQRARKEVCRRQLVFERAKDAVAAGNSLLSVAPPAAAAGSSGRSGPAWPSDTAVWTRCEPALRPWQSSGESVLFLFQRESTDPDDTTSQLVVAKRYRRAAFCKHEHAVFAYLTGALSAEQLRLYVRARLPSRSAPRAGCALHAAESLRLLMPIRPHGRGGARVFG